MLTLERFCGILFPCEILYRVIFLPLPPVYDKVIALLIIIPLGLIFFSSAFLYNKLCDKDLLTSDENKVCEPLKSKWAYLAIFVVGMFVAWIFYLMLTHDTFDLSLPLLVPPLVVAILCELKNGFTPMISVVLSGLCVFCRFIYYCVFHGLGYGFSIILGFAVAFAVISIPKMIFDRNSVKPFDIFLILQISIMASYFSPIYALIFVGALYLLLTVGYEIPNLVAVKRKGSPIFTFRIPKLLLASAVFAAMLLI